MRLSISGGIIGSAIYGYCGRSLLLRPWPRNARGLHLSSLTVLVHFKLFFHHFLWPHSSYGREAVEGIIVIICGASHLVRARSQVAYRVIGKACKVARGVVQGVGFGDLAVAAVVGIGLFESGIDRARRQTAGCSGARAAPAAHGIAVFQGDLVCVAINAFYSIGLHCRSCSWLNGLDRFDEKIAVKKKRILF